MLNFQVGHRRIIGFGDFSHLRHRLFHAALGEQSGARDKCVRADTRHDDEVASLIDRTVARFGRLDVAVNNAGTEGRPGPITEQTAESYAATFDTNVLGTLLGMKHEIGVEEFGGVGRRLRALQHAQ